MDQKVTTYTERQSDYYQRNREKILAWQKKYYQQFREKKLAYGRKYHAMRKQLLEAKREERKQKLEKKMQATSLTYNEKQSLYYIQWKRKKEKPLEISEEIASKPVVKQEALVDVDGKYSWYDVIRINVQRGYSTKLLDEETQNKFWNEFKRRCEEQTQKYEPRNEEINTGDTEALF